MQLSLLRTAFPQLGLLRSYRGTLAVASWDSRGHMTGLWRSCRGTLAVTSWDLRGPFAATWRSIRRLMTVRGSERGIAAHG
jgi:hypothetical protein